MFKIYIKAQNMHASSISASFYPHYIIMVKGLLWSCLYLMPPACFELGLHPFASYDVTACIDTVYIVLGMTSCSSCRLPGPQLPEPQRLAEGAPQAGHYWGPVEGHRGQQALSSLRNVRRNTSSLLSRGARNSVFYTVWCDWKLHIPRGFHARGCINLCVGGSLGYEAISL